MKFLNLYLIIMLIQGFKIEASFENQIDPPNRVNLEVGAWFEIYNFKLIPASGLIRTTRSRYQIKLTPFSAISKIEPISESYFICLASFLKIKNGLSHTKFCVGMFSCMLHVLFSGRITKSKTILLF